MHPVRSRFLSKTKKDLPAFRIQNKENLQHKKFDNIIITNVEKQVENKNTTEQQRNVFLWVSSLDYSLRIDVKLLRHLKNQIHNIHF